MSNNNENSTLSVIRGAAAVAGRGLMIKAAAIGAVLAIVFGGFFAIISLMPGAAGGGVQLAGASCSLPGSGAAAAVGGPDLAQQLKNAQAIDAAAKALGLPGTASRLAIVTAVGESDLINIDHGDAAGPDSRGLFQQRTSQGWGTEAQVMDPTYAATSFLIGPGHDRKGGLVSVPGWDKMDPSAAIHAVQRNADPSHYSRFITRADSIIKQAGIDVARAGTGSASNAVAAVAGVCGTSTAVVMGDAKDDYPYSGSTPPPGVYVQDPWGYYEGECTSWVAWAFNRDHGSKAAPYKFTSATGFANGNGADWRAAWLARGWPVSNTPRPGAVAWWGANGAVGIGPYGHVAYVEKIVDPQHVLISEYNNSFLAPPGHKFDSRVVENTAVNTFLLPPAA